MTKEFLVELIEDAKKNNDACIYLSKSNDGLPWYDQRAINWQELADYLSQHPVMQEGKEEIYVATYPEPPLHTHKYITDYTTGCADVPSGLELPPNFTDITSKFIEQARDAEMKLISELFKTTTGEELTEQNAHRVGIDYGINRSISIDGVIIGQFKQDMLPTDNGYKCSITFVPASPRSAPPNDPGAHSMNIV